LITEEELPVPRQNKQAKNLMRAAAFTALHGPVKDQKTGHVTMTGKRGPSETSPKKRVGRHKDPDRQAARSEALADIRKRIADTVRARWGKSVLVTQW
jgi:hypothetical protein